MEEDQQVSYIGRPFIATSQVWIHAEHGEMTMLVGEENVKFDLHQSILLTDEERKECMKIESSFSPTKEHENMFLQEDTIERFRLGTNPFPTIELAFELTLSIIEVKEPILASDEDEERVLAMMDEGPKRSSRTSPKSLARL